MATDADRPQGGDEEARWLRARLPRHPAPAALRVSIVQALSPAPRPRPWLTWLSPAASALAMAMVMLLWLAPSLPTLTPADPLRPIMRAVINEHARTILWGEARPDLVPAVLPRAMDESGVALNWVFTGDDSIQLINAQPTYLEGRRAIELAYEDNEGHTVTYLIFPEPTLVLPERGRVQVDRWRPLVRRENGFALLLWKQQGLLCVLASDLVSDEDFDKLKEYFVKVRSSTEPYPIY